ncbi:MAG TPA: hypothetical protein VL972_06815 [Solirubrobacteraceae bacterium]|nr:hypothetical protein [Solirubrobacteraceae bacterium]
MSMMPRPRLSYANVVATLALVFAMSGGALAANHYLINSTKQINPKVLKTLRGARGRTGAAGPLGPVGPQGVQGLTGKQGKSEKGEKGEKGEAGFSALSKMPSGASESGDYAIRDESVESGSVQEAVTFPIPLSNGIPHVIYTQIGKPVEPDCPGPGRAAKGFLCIYSAESGNVGHPVVEDAEESPATQGTGGDYGFVLSWTVTEKGPHDMGTYTATAP